MKYRRLVDAKSVKTKEPKKEVSSFWKTSNTSDLDLKKYNFLKTNK